MVTRPHKLTVMLTAGEMRMLRTIAKREGETLSFAVRLLIRLRAMGVGRTG